MKQENNNLDFDKLDESFWMLGNILPLGSEENRKKLQQKIGVSMKLDSFISILMRSLVEMIKEYPEEALGYLDFIKESIQYCEGDREKPPVVDYDPEEVKKLYAIKKIQDKKK